MKIVTIKRKTKETQIEVMFNSKGTGEYNINTSIPFLDHMLELFALHGNFDLKIVASGDTEIDNHHLVEDIGIILGMTIKKVAGNKKGMARYGNFLMPMDEALSYVVVDLSGRPYLSFDVKFKKIIGPVIKTIREEFDYSLIREFFRAVSNNAEMNLHIKNHSGENNHHIAESVFKGFAKALSQALTKQPKTKKIPSTKGIL